MNTAAVRSQVSRMAFVSLLALWTAPPVSAQVTLTQAPDRITVDINGQPFTVFYIGGPNLNRPYVHPLRTASGKVVDRSFPAGQLPGETTDHPHHAGLFYGHGDVNGYNYWAIQNVPIPPSAADPKMGRIVLDRVLSVKSGRTSGTVDAIFNWLKPDGKPLLIEARTMTFGARPELRIIDVDLELTAVERVVFGDTKEGTFAMRMATALEEPPVKPPAEANAPARTGTLINAAGAQREANVWGKRSPWVDYAGVLDGEHVGVVMMDHPDNPRHPTYWHSRGYGLHAINPFGLHDFLNDKTQDGSLTLAPGERVRFRYRVVMHGAASRDTLEELYKEFARTKHARQ